MAIYHLSVKIGSRSKGQSAIAASAYRSGTRLTDEKGAVSDYTRKKGIVHSEVTLCRYAPKEYIDREKLWQAVHDVEKSKDAQLWREFEVALPKELNTEQQVELVRDYCKGLTKQGMCVDWSIHDTGNGNPHVHIMATIRSIDEHGKWLPKSRKVYQLDKQGNRQPLIDKETGKQKTDNQGRKQWKSRKENTNNWNDKKRIEEWRKSWETSCNKALKKAKKKARITRLSYKKIGLERKPTVHVGYGTKRDERTKSNQIIMLNNQSTAEKDKDYIERLRKERNHQKERITANREVYDKKDKAIFAKRYKTKHKAEIKAYDEADTWLKTHPLLDQLTAVEDIISREQQARQAQKKAVFSTQKLIKESKRIRENYRSSNRTKDKDEPSL